MSNLSAFQAKSWIGETREYLCVISTRNVRLLFREDDTYTVLCFPRIMAYEYDPINHPAWIFGAEIYDVSPLSVQALCKLFSSRHLPSRGETCPPLATCSLLPSFSFHPVSTSRSLFFEGSASSPPNGSFELLPSNDEAESFLLHPLDYNVCVIPEDNLSRSEVRGRGCSA